MLSYTVWSIYALHQGPFAVWYGPYTHLRFEGVEVDGTVRYNAQIEREWMVEVFLERCVQDPAIVRWVVAPLITSLPEASASTAADG